VAYVSATCAEKKAVIDDVGAVRASEVYAQTVSFLKSGDLANGVKYAGAMSHYIADLAVFGHVMGAATPWGSEHHHSDYEDYVNERTSTYESEFNTYLIFDGKLETLSAYDAAENCKAILISHGLAEKVCWYIPKERYVMTINSKDSEYVDLCAVCARDLERLISESLMTFEGHVVHPALSEHDVRWRIAPT